MGSYPSSSKRQLNWRGEIKLKKIKGRKTEDELVELKPDTNLATNSCTKGEECATSKRLVNVGKDGSERWGNQTGI